MKAHGIHQSQYQTTIASTPLLSARRKSPVADTTSSKKRKLDKFVDTDANAAVDDDEGLATAVKHEKKAKVAVKAESSKAVKPEVVGADKIKEEAGYKGDLARSSSHPEDQHPFTGFGTDGADDDVIFNDFVTPRVFDQYDNGTHSTDNGFDQRNLAALNVDSASNNGKDVQGSILIAD